jgi:hypothetical protein
VDPHEPRSFVLLLVVGLAVVGMWRFYRSAPATMLFLVVYTIVVMLWPFEPSRFIIALWPMWPLMVGCGVVSCWQRLQRASPGVARRSGFVALGLVVTTFVTGSAWYNVMGYSRKWWITSQRDAGKRAKPIVEWAARYTDSTAVLSTEDDLIVYLYANRKAVPTSTFMAKQRLRYLTDAEDLEQVRAIFRDYNPGWFIVGSQQGFRTAKALEAAPDSAIRYVGHTPDVLIYQRRQP